MSSESASAKDIFLQAADMASPAERAAYLDVACQGNPRLRQHVEVLLHAHERPESLLDKPALAIDPRAAGDPQTLPPPPTESLGTIIGPFKLLQVIGEGGMGVVYMAEQAEPVERRVALKIIKPGMDSRQVIARFEAERQALAMMDHQNIAKVFEAGTTDSGRPYFVMELVKGIPITKYCDEKRLSLKERLELMIPVCQAIQHAHQKGIIHRDIKPTNVLVAQYDGRPVPKVIDFGVAKATAQKLTEQTMFTELGQVVGTLEYMSPEQAELNQLDIDTRSDIYSLGVLLYELLTGSTPFDKQKLRSAAFHEMLRIIREDEPPKPSTKLSTIDTLASVAANRSVEPARLGNNVKGELDWIVMKALEKDRNRRYETADSFAGDLVRYLNDEQVHAHPPSAAYRFGKFARRNRATLTTAAIVGLALLVGTAVSTWQAIRATRAESVAKANESRAISEEQKALAAAAAERAAKEAEASQRHRAEEQARQLDEQRRLLENNQRVHALVADQILAVLRTVSTDDATRRQLLVAAMARLSDLDPKERVAAYRRMGNILFSAGQFSEAFSAFREGLNLDPRDVALYISRGDAYFRRHDFAKAAQDYSGAINNRPASEAANGNDLPYCRRGIAHYRLRQFDQALADFHSSYDAHPQATMQFLGRQFAGGGGEIFTSHASEQVREGLLALADRYVADGKNSPRSRGMQAAFRGLFGQFEGVEANVQARLAADADSPFNYYELALLALRKADLSRYRQFCQTMIEKFGNDSDRGRRYLALLACSLAPQSLDDYTRAIAIARRGVGEKPNSSTTQFALGSLLLRAGQYEEARRSLEGAIKSRDEADGAEWYSPFLLAVTFYKLGQKDDALRELHRAKERVKQPRSAGINWRFAFFLDQFEKEATQLIEPPSESPKPADGC